MPGIHLPRWVGFCLCFMAMGTYLGAAWGILPNRDLVARILGGHGHERYPCETHGCGCSTAHQCWTACCCHSMAERLAWAIENEVDPPRVVRPTPDQWAAGVRLASNAATASRTDSCCPASQASRSVERHTLTDTASESITKSVIVMQTNCSGLRLLSMSPLPPVPQISPVRLITVHDETNPGLRVIDRLDRPADRSIEPATPPPRV